MITLHNFDLERGVLVKKKNHWKSVSMIQLDELGSRIDKISDAERKVFPEQFPLKKKKGKKLGFPDGT